MKEPIKSQEFVISFDKSNELQTEVTVLNLPTGCLITTKMKYSASCAVTSEFVTGVMYNETLKRFESIVTMGSEAIDDFKSFSGETYKKMKNLWDDNKESREWIHKDEKDKGNK